MARRTVSGAELRELARTWRAGNKAFREIFDVKPKAPDRPYNEVVLRPGDMELVHELALEDCNTVWSDAEARKATQAQAAELSERRRAGAPSAELRGLRRELGAARAKLRGQLLEEGGIVGAINRTESSRDAYRNKVILVSCLGRTVRELTEPEESA